MKLCGLLNVLLLACTAIALDCRQSALSAVLPANVSVTWAYKLAENSIFTPPAADVGFPIAPTNLRASCAVAVEVPSSENATYNFGMFLPDEWNGRFLYGL